jgi:hypothetical protein
MTGSFVPADQNCMLCCAVVGPFCVKIILYYDGPVLCLLTESSGFRTLA